MMFGLGAHDPVAFISMPLFLLAVAFVATLIPGRRAMRVEPDGGIEMWNEERLLSKINFV